jgi:hypothetical protein
MHSDSKKRRSSLALLSAAGDAKRSRAASRPANCAADCHPPVLRRFAPSNMRLQQTPTSASKLASAVAADPQHS